MVMFFQGLGSPGQVKPAPSHFFIVSEKFHDF